MSEWPEVALESVLVPGGVSYGIVQPGSPTDHGVPIVRVADLEGDAVRPSRPLRVSAEVESAYARTRLVGGEVLVSIVGTVGRVAVVPQSLAGWNVARAVAVLKPRSGADSDWIRYALLGDDAQRQMGIRKTDTVQATLNLRDLRSVTLPWPEAEVRQRIVGVLGALDELIETNRQFAQQVRDLSSSMYAKFAAAARGQVTIGEVAAVSDKKVRPGVGMLRYIDIAAMGDGYLEFPAPIDWGDAPSRARIGVEDGSTLWSTVRPNRRAHALVVDAPADLVASTGIAVLTPRGIGPAELFAACDRDGFVDQLVAMADGSAYPAVRPSAFSDVVIPELGSSASAEFERVMWPLWRDVHAAGEDIARLTRARDELLPLLMSGRVRVREVA